MFDATSVHVAPPSRETWTAPSSVPTQRMSGDRGDSEMVVISANEDSPSFFDRMHGQIEKAFAVFQREKIKMTGSSRTDAGVHALQN
jgi:hypothetical protein